MEVKFYFRMLQRSWWVVIIATLAAVVAALLVSYLTRPIYQATSRFIVSPSPSLILGGSNLVNSLSTLDKRSIISTYAEVLNSPRIHSETYKLLGLTEAAMVDYSYNAVALPDANIIEFSVQGPDPKTVYLLANGIGQHGIEYVQSLYQVYDLILLDPATMPVDPISPQPLRNAGVAFVVGLALGVVLALIRELIRTPLENFIRRRNVDNMSLALNRNAFEQILAEAAFGSSTDFSLCIVHLNGMVDYVNILPQSTLQIIFRNVTKRMEEQLRGNDRVGRWSELDFIVLLTVTTGDAAVNTMSRVRAALSNPISLDVSGEELQLDPQIGIAEYRVDDTAQSMIKNMQWALASAKMHNGIYLLKATENI
jgi:capsular polysaccharide biosynthesis protein